MTMSLSVARPIVTAALGFRSAPDRDGNNAWNTFVARFPTSGGLVTLTDIRVCGAAWEEPIEPMPDICGWGWKLGGGGGALVGYGGGRPPTLVGYTGCGPGCGRRAAGEAQFGWCPGGPGGGPGGPARGGPG